MEDADGGGRLEGYEKRIRKVIIPILSLGISYWFFSDYLKCRSKLYLLIALLNAYAGVTGIMIEMEWL